MGINKVKKGNMYKWINKTRNFIGGKCPHNCKYCFVLQTRFKKVVDRYSGELRLLEEEFKKPLGKNKTIFICDCNDLFAEPIPTNWINKVLDFLNEYPYNTYLLQTKNPKRYLEFKDRLKLKNIILGTTIETNMDNILSKAPPPRERAKAMSMLKGFRTMVSIEPIQNFNLDELIFLIKSIKPEFVSVGADSKGHRLIEPDKIQIKQLIKELRAFTKVKLKDNLARLCPMEELK